MPDPDANSPKKSTMPAADGSSAKKSTTLNVPKKTRSASSEPAVSLKMLQDELQAVMRDLSARIKSDMQSLLEQHLQTFQTEQRIEPPAMTGGHTLATRITDIGPINGLLDAWDDGNEFNFSTNMMTYGAAVEMDRRQRHRARREQSRPRRKKDDFQYEQYVEVQRQGVALETAAPLAAEPESRRRGELQNKEGKGKRQKPKRDREEADNLTARDARNLKKNKPVQHDERMAEVIGSAAAGELAKRDERESAPLHARSQRSSNSRSIGLTALVKKPAFDYLFAALVMLNTGLIGVQTQIMAKQNEFEIPEWCRACEILFTFFFTVELMLRVCVDRCGFFFCGRKPRFWNCFDFTAVASQLVEMVFLHHTSNHTHLAFVLIRVLRMLRALRVLRRYNVESKIGELNTLVVSLMGSAKAFMLACVVMFLIVYIFAVFVTYLVLDHRSGANVSGLQDVDLELQRQYGTLALSVLTLFQTISGGCDWGDALDPLYTHISPQMSIVFSLYIAFVVFAVMNVITGVFVEAALDNARSERDSVTLTMVRNFMGAMLLESTEDTNDATVTYEKFKAHLNDDWMQRYFKSIDLDVSEAKGLFSLLDIDGAGEVLAEDFLSGCMALRGSARSLDLRIVRYESKRFQRKVEKHARLVERHLVNMEAAFQDVLDKLNLAT